MNPYAKKILGLFFALFLPISFVVLWKLKYKMYPQGDEAFYKIVSQEIYLTAKTNGLWEGVKFAYLHKHWKPILHPVFGALTLVLTGGDVRHSIALYDLLVYSTFLTLIYFYLCRYIGEFRSIFAVIFISSIPWVFGISTNFNSEVGYLTAVVAILLYYSRHPEINSNKIAVIYALLFSLASSLRPVETVLLFGVIIVGYLGEMKYKNRTSYLPLLVGIIWTLFFLAVISPPYFILKRDWYPTEINFILIATIVIFAATLAAAKKHRANFIHVLAISLFFLIQLFWYVPAAFTFFDWIMLANFGVLAQQTGNRLGRPLTEFVDFYINRIGWTPFVLVGLICVTYLKSTFLLLKNFRLWLFFSGAVLIPLIAGSFSYNGDVRYYYGSWVVGLLLLIQTVLNKSNPRLFFATSAFSGMAIVLYVGLSAFLLDEVNNIVPWSIRERFGFSFYNLHAKTFASEPLALEKLKSLVNKTQFDYRFYIFFKPKGDLNETPDPFALTLISREQGFNWKSEFVGFLPDDEKYDYHLDALKGYDYIIVGPRGDHWNLQNTHKWNRLINSLLESCSSNGKQQTDLDSAFKFNSTYTLELENKVLGEYCVFKNKIKEPASATNLFH